MKDPQSLLDQLMTPPYNFKLKGSGELVFHLGCGFTHDSTGTLYVWTLESALIEWRNHIFNTSRENQSKDIYCHYRRDTILRLMIHHSYMKMESKYTNHLLVPVKEGLYQLEDLIFNQPS